MKKNYREVKNPRQDTEYWVCVDCVDGMPYYFKTKEEAEAFQQDQQFADSVIFQECFN